MSDFIVAAFVMVFVNLFIRVVDGPGWASFGFSYLSFLLTLIYLKDQRR